MDDETPPYRVAVNQEGQYALWPGHLPLPMGWQAEGLSGTKEDCLAHIAAEWRDLRPRSLQRPEAKESDPSNTK
jgi:MbtH protein